MPTNKNSARSGTLSRAKLALVHVAVSRLGMNEEDYRALLRRVAGVDSSRDLNEGGFTAVIAEFQRLGFDPQREAERRKLAARAPGFASEAQKRLIRNMWNHYKGKHDPDGLRGWLDGHFKVSDLRFLSSDKAQKVIHALRQFPGTETAY